MINKRGQVTIFIIIAIILIAVVALYFTLRGTLQKEVYTPEVAPIANFVQECIDQTFEDSLIAVAKQGGYSGYTYLEKTNEEGVTYYLLEGKDYVPSKKRVEKEISEYLNRKFFLCSRHFVNFTEYQIEEGNFESSIRILDKKVVLTINYPLTITKGKSSSRIEDFESEVQVRLGIVYDSVIDFMDKQRKSSDKVCLSCLDMSIQNDLYVDMISYYNKTVVFTFRDENSKLNDKPLEWVFANKY
ncbi:MAG: hypothetical protein QQN41_04175 [Nitrosopumilus sp.]